jgi:serine/threonine-protein kinase NIM1
LSPCQPTKFPEPIECYTKKYNNVPVEKFKNPIETNASISASATTVIPVHNNLSTLARNNSLINSSRIVPKRNNDKNGGLEIVQSNDIIQVRSYSNDEPSDESSVDSDCKDFDRFMMLPTRSKCDANQLRALHPLEQETRKILKSYGIGDELLEKHIEHGPRSEVIGIYRIVIMRLKTQKEQASIISHNSPVISDKLNNNHHRVEKSKKHATKSKCAIL